MESNDNAHKLHRSIAVEFVRDGTTKVCTSFAHEGRRSLGMALLKYCAYLRNHEDVKLTVVIGKRPRQPPFEDAADTSAANASSSGASAAASEEADEPRRASKRVKVSTAAGGTTSVATTTTESSNGPRAMEMFRALNRRNFHVADQSFILQPGTYHNLVWRPKARPASEADASRVERFLELSAVDSDDEDDALATDLAAGQPAPTTTTTTTAASKAGSTTTSSDQQPAQVQSDGSLREQYVLATVEYTYQASKERASAPTRTELSCLRIAFEGGISRLALGRLLTDAWEYAYPRKLLQASTTLFCFDALEGEWMELGDILPRPLPTVYLPGTIKEDVVADLRRFLDSQRYYEDPRRGLTHKRIYLLEGDPGTGKTTLVRALAAAFQLDLALIHFNAALDDQALLQAVMSLGKRTALLLEDIDCLFTGREKDNDSSCRVTFSGLLNTLDGAACCSQLVVFMTTNHIERLDPALIRPGRVDRVVSFTAQLEEQQIRAMVLNLVPHQAARVDAFVQKGNFIGVTTSILQQFLVENRNCADIASRDRLDDLKKMAHALEGYRRSKRGADAGSHYA